MEKLTKTGVGSVIMLPVGMKVLFLFDIIAQQLNILCLER
jgi:hypothetical protein